jgi:hypothetical protein
VPLLHALAVLLFALACWPSAARAATVYDTFALGQGGIDAIIGQFNGKDFQLAYSFEISVATGNVPLESITVRLRHSPDPAAEEGDFTLRVREDDAGQPGAVLEAWTYTDVLTSQTNVQFDSVTQPVLLAGSTYWLTMGIEAGTGLGLWMAAEPKSVDLLYAETGVLDPTWLPPAQPYLIGLATVEVPEPAHAWLVVAGAGVLARFRRRRLRA